MVWMRSSLAGFSIVGPVASLSGGRAGLGRVESYVPIVQAGSCVVVGFCRLLGGREDGV